eukprot:8557-Heterococcus_DN1.PRE.5
MPTVAEVIPVLARSRVDTTTVDRTCFDSVDTSMYSTACRSSLSPTSQPPPLVPPPTPGDAAAVVAGDIGTLLLPVPLLSPAAV